MIRGILVIMDVAKKIDYYGGLSLPNVWYGGWIQAFFTLSADPASSVS